jgi:hypothetical protein
MPVVPQTLGLRPIDVLVDGVIAFIEQPIELFRGDALHCGLAPPSPRPGGLG